MTRPRSRPSAYRVADGQGSQQAKEEEETISEPWSESPAKNRDRGRRAKYQADGRWHSGRQGEGQARLPKPVVGICPRPLWLRPEHDKVDPELHVRAHRDPS